MDILAIIFAFAAGCCTAIEQTINGRLGQVITPGVATLHNLATGAIVLVCLNLFHGNIANYAKITSISPFYLFGGLFGAAIIYLSARAVPILGITKTLALVITGQLICGLAGDIFVHGMQVSASKWIGAVFLLIGSYLIIR